MTVKITKPEINVREQLNELKKPTGVAGEAMLRAETPQEQQALIGISGRRNFIMNGRGFIDQRGKSGASLNAGEFSLDRWSSSTAGTTMTQLSGGGFKSARTSGIAWSRISHRVEDCYNAIGTNELTISFDIKWNTHSGNDNSMVYLRWLQDNGTETGTAAALDISKTGLSSKEKFTKTFTMPSDATNPEHLMILFYGCNGTASVWDFELDNIQLELGKVATPFEHRSYGEELALCQRYFRTYGGNTGNERIAVGFYHTTSNFRLTIPLDPVMRATPTLGISSHAHLAVESNGGSASNTAHALDQASPRVAALVVTTTRTASAGDAGQLMFLSGSGRLTLSAEI